MKFYGEILILILMLITNLRVFFVNHTRRDSLASLAPLCFTLTILQLFAWGIDAFTVSSIIVSLLVFLSNFHAIFRFSEHLYIDHYSPLMKVWAVFTSIITVVIITATVIFAPVEIRNEKAGVKETVSRYTGSFRSGFQPASIFKFADCFFYEYKKMPPLGSEETPSEALVILLPDKRGDSKMYKPYLQLMAQKNYTVCSADFFTDDLHWHHSFGDKRSLRRLTSVLQSLSNNQKFMSQREFYTYNITLECNALLSLINEKYGADKEFYLISDVMGNTALKDFAELHPDRVKGIFYLDSIPEYNTPGYGLIEQTDPLLAFAMGFYRDSKLTAAHIMTEKTINMINELKADVASETAEENNDTESI